MTDNDKNVTIEVSNADVSGKLVNDKIIKSFANCLLPLLRNYFDSAEGQAAYLEWKKQSEAK